MTNNSDKSAAQQLKDYAQRPDPFDYSPGELAGLQLQAMQEQFASVRKHIRVLDQRANDLGISAIEALPDIVPLLFSHQTYKSYPASFVDQSRWALMNKWLNTLSIPEIGEIDVSDVVGTDAWVARMAEHGHHVLMSSGTSGKTSFLNRSEADCHFNYQSTAKSIRTMKNIPEGSKQAVFLLGPRNGSHVFVGNMKEIAREFGRPEATYWLSDLTLTEDDIKRQAELRNRINEGTATPADIQELEEHGRQRQQQMREDMQTLAEALLKHRGEPVFIVGLWLPHFMLMEEAHRLGMADGELHPESTIFFGGGLKGAKLPADYREQVTGFYGLDTSRYFNIYGMTELSSGFPACSAGRYHISPWIIPLVLDEAGEQWQSPDSAADGRLTGRMAFYDTAVEARWGGVITSDKVEIDFSPCACGRASPGVVSVSRYADLPGGDDKLSCAGTMASYVRGVIEE